MISGGVGKRRSLTRSSGGPGERRRGGGGQGRHSEWEAGLELTGVSGQEGIQRDLRWERDEDDPPRSRWRSGKRSVSVPAEDTLTFWKGIADVGLLGEVVTNISSELLEMLNGVQQRQETAALQDTGTPRG